MTASPHRRLLAALLLAATAPAPLLAQATWDDLPGGNFVSSPLPYAGHNFYYGDGAFGTGTALQYSSLGAICRSGSNCAYNGNGNTPIRIEALTTNAADAFTLDGWMRAGYPGQTAVAVDVIAQGFVGSSAVPAFTMLLALSPNGFSAVSFTSMNINKLLLTPANGAGAPADGYMLLDDVTFGRAAGTPATTTPEPATLGLLAGGLLGVAGIARRARPRRAGAAARHGDAGGEIALGA
jgi:hypothetical protein